MQFGGHRRFGCAQFQPKGDQTLLRAVVQITFEPAPRIVSGRDDSGPRCGQLGVSALAIAVATRSAKSPTRASESGGSGPGCVDPTIAAPQSRPSTTIGAPTAQHT